MTKKLTTEQELGQEIVHKAMYRFGIIFRHHTMASLSGHMCSSTTWVDTYNEMEIIIKTLKEFGAKEEQISHSYDMISGSFLVTFDCKMF